MHNFLFYFSFFYISIYICLDVLYVFFTELTNKMDLQAQSGKTLYGTSEAASTGPVNTADAPLCPYVNLSLCNTQPAGEKHIIYSEFPVRE